MTKRGGVLFLIFLAALPVAMLLAALASPWVQKLLAPLAEFPLHRIFSRLTLLLAFGWIIWVMLRFGLARREVLGYDLPGRAFLLHVLTGLVAGLALMTIAVAPLFALDLREWNPARLIASGGLWLVAMKGLGSGLLVALIEETLFRGAMQGALDRTGAKRLALLAVPALYAAVHFFGRAEAVPYDQVTAFSGFTAASGFFSDLAQPLRIWDAFIALYCVGLLLALVRRRWGSLAACIGLHAGFIAVITIFRKVSVATVDSEWSFLVGNHDGLLGLWIALLALAASLSTWTPMRR